MSRVSVVRGRVASSILVAGLMLHPAFAPAAEDVAQLVERGQLRSAEALLTPRTSAGSTDAAALALLAQVRIAQDRHADAIALAERAVAAAPTSAEAHAALASACGDKASADGGLGALGLAKRFKKEAEEALRLDPSRADVMQWLLEFHQRAPGIAGGDKKQIPALEQRLRAADPLRGQLYDAQRALQRKDSTAAVALMRKAVASEGTSVRASLALARYLASPSRDLAEAEALAVRACERAPWDKGAWTLRAAVQAYQRAWPELEATLAAAEAAVPQWLGAHYQAARQMVTDRREPARAEALLRRYLATPPEYGQPSHAAARWRLALALEQQGRKPDAIAELEAAVKAEPSLKDAKKDLKRLRG